MELALLRFIYRKSGSSQLTDIEIKELIAKVGGAINITALFLKDSSIDHQITSKNGKPKSAHLIPRRAINTETLQKIDKHKCPTDPYVYKAIYTKEKWHNSYWTIPTGDSGNDAI